jgi:Ca-activated chloride channel homolog
VILSDGEATEDNWRDRLDELKSKGIRVIGLGVGTAAGSMIPDGTDGFVKDERGAVVLSKLESATLQELAQATNGVYRDASGWIDLAALIDQTVNAGRKGQFVDKTTVRLVDRFQWPLALAVWCLCLSFYYEFPVRPRPRDIRLQPNTPPSLPQSRAVTGATVAVAVLLFIGLAVPHAAAVVKVGNPSAAKPAGQDEPPLLGKIVGRLSSKDTLRATDLSEFAHETLNWGRRLKDQGQPVPEGPVNDALIAVDQLEAMDSKNTDWAKLRADLEALKEKPPEQKPPPQSDQKKSSQDKNQSQQKPSDSKDQSSSSQDKNKEQENTDAAKNQQQPSPAEPSAPKPDKAGSDQSAFGDMNKKEQPPAPPPQENTQKVGGAAEKKDANKEPVDPALTLPMQKLDQLRDQDSPAQLFQLMEGGDRKATAKKPAKNW